METFILSVKQQHNIHKGWEHYDVGD